MLENVSIRSSQTLSFVVGCKPQTVLKLDKTFCFSTGDRHLEREEEGKRWHSSLFPTCFWIRLKQGFLSPKPVCCALPIQEADNQNFSLQTSFLYGHCCWRPGTGETAAGQLDSLLFSGVLNHCEAMDEIQHFFCFQALGKGIFSLWVLSNSLFSLFPPFSCDVLGCITQSAYLPCSVMLAHETGHAGPTGIMENTVQLCLLQHRIMFCLD